MTSRIEIVHRPGGWHEVYVPDAARPEISELVGHVCGDDGSPCSFRLEGSSAARFGGLTLREAASRLVAEIEARS